MEETSGNKGKDQLGNVREQEEFNEERLALTLGLPYQNPRFSLPPSPPPPQSTVIPSFIVDISKRTRHGYRNDDQENDINPPPYPWSTARPTTIHNLDHLLTNQIHTIYGEINCKACDSTFTLELDLQTKFREVSSFLMENMGMMHDRAPKKWTNPTLPKCPTCGNLSKPVISKDKCRINWLFMFLGQVLGCCTLDHLKHFCQHNNLHRTGAKDRLLYLTYLELCKQLYHNGPSLR